MCRRCGESDKRGNSRDRKRRRQWLLDEYGDGVTAPCWLCDEPVNISTLEVDRIVPGGPYARYNIRPACAGCNRSRSDLPIPEGCMYG